MSTTDAPDPFDAAARTLIPPPELRRRVSGTPSELEYVRAAVEYATILRAVCRLGAEEWVLEPGCGAGRVAAALAGYLRPPGAYRGFDIHLPSIEFARRAFAPWPHFAFEHADIRTEYFLDSPGAFEGQRVPPERYHFPYPDRSFDFVFTVSLYTHMLPEATQRFLAETARVLRPRARHSQWVGARSRGPRRGRRVQARADADGDGGPPACRARRDPSPRSASIRCARGSRVAHHGRRLLAGVPRPRAGGGGPQGREMIPGGWTRPRGWTTLLDVLTFEKA